MASVSSTLSCPRTPDKFPYGCWNESKDVDRRRTIANEYQWNCVVSVLIESLTTVVPESAGEYSNERTWRHGRI